MAEEVTLKEDLHSLIKSLPLDELGHPSRLRNYKGFWSPELGLPYQISSGQQYRPRDTDVLLVSPPKCGTTWLKALTFATVNRSRYSPSSPDHPLLTKNPHECVRCLEGITDFSEQESIPPPRLLATHMAYSQLPESTASSGCRMVFICRDPKDQLVSEWFFFNAVMPEGIEKVSLPRLHEMFCEGVSRRGPTWDHILEYWRASLERPSQVLFLKYEDMQRDPAGNLRRLAELVGFPFSEEEEREGVLEEIIRLCSFENLSGLNANKEGDEIPMTWHGAKRNTFFRKGKVGDWKNHLTTEMAAKLDAIFREKLAGSGLDLGDCYFKDACDEWPCTRK